ncbi:BON domain-containing protein [Magnetospirillum sp. UT-4]|uniref:BON domain-containing protein n=1 Tax=Magnetospirillum sp. UT-4 TaxID=2681467 RepID=UPI00137CC1DC|nr:BON domain-containing protein [Magnetospirillum sp. UT-4]CAA7624431.1 Periplasmic or secreted lipoprotein [Magnetospirillum sp. UT-4]
MRASILLLALLATACETAGPAAPPPPVPVERPRAVSNRDDVVRATVLRRIAELDRAAFRAVTAEVWGGRVLLLGAVVKPEQRRRAEQAARAVEGAAEVLNEVVLAEESRLDSYRPDPAREEAVRRQLGLEGKAGTVVRVVNGIAFLLGGVARREDAESMKADAGDVEGVKWVVAHLKPSAP